MKKKSVQLNRKLILQKTAIAALTSEEKNQLVGGAPLTLVTQCGGTSACQVSSPRPGRPCCIPDTF
ncbi:MAG TPA: class I lanthipeptide [Chitinophaga sp.]|uniref:class I lanthipeptide n=1 Tax=Chitinophaga sp. TaxID=1869181 RepID=UPI002B7EC72D|nr:class I lanthipeptide [Chitinophaga sp.]HVI43403.1 class I lanthipeptide [Chitinophaga sp.]